ncbi:cation diffusion facilitator family transporter [Paenibacillus sp. MBLB4367]|uniref:cation diffusion facilitator family transporter n=1 Tax=Paenibacillus sp. MBLB4367 TaxID=3384767 RepID=UPI003908204C
MMYAEKNKTMFAAGVSLFSNIALTLLKLVVGVLFKSGVLIADGIHNAGDVIASATAFGSMRISNQPADDDHPYGHGKAEVVGAGIVAVILLLAAVWIGYSSVQVLFGPPPEAHVIALIAAFLSLAWKQWLYVYTIRIGKLANSKALIATAYDHLADVYASAAAVVGITLALVGDWSGITLLKYGDPAAGIIVALLVLKLAYEMGKESVDILMDRTVDPDKIKQFATLVKSVREVKRIDRLRAREHGQYILVDVRASIPGHLSIQEGHDISREIKKAIKDAHADVNEVLVHLNPWYAEDEVLSITAKKRK